MCASMYLWTLHMRIGQVDKGQVGLLAVGNSIFPEMSQTWRKSYALSLKWSEPNKLKLLKAYSQILKWSEEEEMEYKSSCPARN